jgi:hypothetical protein
MLEEQRHDLHQARDRNREDGSNNQPTCISLKRSVGEEFIVIRHLISPFA